MFSKMSVRLAGASLLSIAIVQADPAIAQETPQETRVDDDRIIVTGTREQVLTEPSPTGSRLGLTVLETPATVNTVTGDDLRARGDISIVDAATRAPGVTNDGNPGNGGLSFVMRGFNGQGSVLQLYDGIRLFPNNGSISFPSDPWNVERIEVLSGPASVLFGQGAMGGVVNVIPRSPNHERTELDGEAGYGSQNSWHIAAGVGGPLGERLAFRADAAYRQSEGYVDRGESDNLALSAALDFRASDSLTFTLREDFGLTHPMKYFGTPLVNSKLDTDIRHENYNVGDATNRYRDNRLALTADWAVTPDISFTSTAYWLASNRIWRNLETYCWIGPSGECPNGIGYGTPGNIYRADNYGIIHDVDQYGTQGFLKISRSLNERGMTNDLLIGYDLSRVTLNYSHQFDSDYQEDEVVPTGFNPGLFLDTVGLIPRYHTRTRTWAIYAEDRLALSDKFSLVGGLRHEENRVGRWNWVYNAQGQITGDTPALNGGASAFKKLNSTTWRVGAVYQPSDNLSFYAQFATAVDPLGTLTTFSTSAPQFQLTYADGYQYEVGLKALLMNGRGSFTLAAYRLVKQNLFTQTQSGGAIDQVGQRSSQGIEASLDLALPEGFELSANGTVLDANFDDFTGFVGKTPPGVPEAASNVELRWTNGRFSTRANWRYVGRRFTDNANDFRVPAYNVVDLAASYALSTNWALDIRLYNLLDADYATATYNDEQWILGRPRSVDMSVRASF